MSVVEPLQILVGVCKVTGLAFVIVVSFNIKSRIKWLNLGEKLVTAALLLTSIVLRHKSPNGPWLECLKAALCLASTTEVVMNYFVKRLSHGNGSGRLCNSVLRSEPFCLSFTYMELIAFCLSLIPKVVAFLVFMVIKNSTYSECVIIPSLCLDSTMSAYSLWRLWRLLISNSIPQGERIRSLRAWMALFFCVSAAATSLILAVGLVAVLPGGIIPVSRSLLWTAIALILSLPSFPTVWRLWSLWTKYVHGIPNGALGVGAGETPNISQHGEAPSRDIELGHCGTSVSEGSQADFIETGPEICPKSGLARRLNQPQLEFPMSSPPELCPEGEIGSWDPVSKG